MMQAPGTGIEAPQGLGSCSPRPWPWSRRRSPPIARAGLDRAKTEISVQYVDHNLLQLDSLNADDHLFLESACRRFGIWYSGPTRC